MQEEVNKRLALNKELEEKSIQIKKLEDADKSLHVYVSGVNSQNKEKSNLIVQLEGEVKALKEEVKNLTSEINSLKNNSSLENSGLQKSFVEKEEAYIKQINDLTEQNKNHVDKLENDLKTKIIELHNAKKQKDDELAIMNLEMEENKDNYTFTLNELNRTISDLKEKLVNDQKKTGDMKSKEEELRKVNFIFLFKILYFFIGIRGAK